MARYTSDGIEALTFVEAVRKRPGMYFGDVDGRGMHHMLWEIVGNSIDEHRAGFGSFVRVAIDGDAITIEDDGRGLPSDVIELVMTRSQAGVAYRKGHVQVRGGLMGAGVAAVNALCARCDVEVGRDGQRYAQSCARGVSLGPLRELGPAARSGTRITFVPDPTIFDHTAWDRDAIARRLREIAAMAPRLTAILDHDAVRCPDGLVDHVRYLARSKDAPIALGDHRDGIDVEVALVWTDTRRATLRGFVNMELARGQHVDGLADGIHAAFARLAPRLSSVHRAAFREVIEPGLVAIVHVSLDDPRFGELWRGRLDNPEVRPAVAAVVADQLYAALLADPVLAATLLSRVPS